MLVVPVKDSDSIEKALKKFKKKVEKTGMIRALRTRQAFEKPSVTRRQQIIKAKYRSKMLRENTL